VDLRFVIGTTSGNSEATKGCLTPQTSPSATLRLQAALQLDTTGFQAVASEHNVYSAVIDSGASTTVLA
jgi:hypothetical protein